jgi:hypothetical protein
MKQYAWAVLGTLGTVMGAGAGAGLLTIGSELYGQASPPPSVELKQNYPNPFNPATTIPFTLSADLFANGHRPKITLTIYNVLAQVVAYPILQGTGESLQRPTELTCSPTGGVCAFTAYWNGNVLDTDREAASGIYIYQLIVDGHRFTKKMIIMK